MRWAIIGAPGCEAELEVEEEAAAEVEAAEADETPVTVAEFRQQSATGKVKSVSTLTAKAGTTLRGQGLPDRRARNGRVRLDGLLVDPEAVRKPSTECRMVVS
jgi:hypothetical protein